MSAATERDPTRRDIPINPPEHSSKELWSTMQFRCSIEAGLGGGNTPEVTLMENNDGKHPSEVNRIKQGTEVPKK